MLILITVILLLAGLGLVFASNRYGIIAVYAGLCVAAVKASLPTVSTLIFWGIATVIVVVLSFMLPKSISGSRRGLGYIAGAALAGAMTGLVISHAWMIIGGVAGAILGGIAYSKTPAGKALGFPSSKFLNYLCAKGLPAVIAVCMAGTALLWLIFKI
ncbi:hypothetical protein [Duncaniella muris]|uniref:hypothetical protein n=1 Tax=Duncaniella muris TaxID=2094150 RepID=UPI00136DB337|nr:hypothetical protein [Duncaniella muris]NBH91588.1 hypothetical protein [Muribaculaceae bacterium S4]NBI20014.1 hypothetical protein [Muribaculaceae bacterium Z1]